MTESEYDPATALSEAERERIAVYVKGAFPRLPAWLFPAVGIAAGAMLATRDIDNTLVWLVSTVVFGAMVGAMVALLAQRAGAQPRLAGMPPALRRPLLVFWGVAAALILAGGAVATFVAEGPYRHTVYGAAVAVLIGVGGLLAQRRYTAQAARLARDAGIEL